MKRILPCLLMMMLSLALSPRGYASGDIPGPGDVFPDLTLPVPKEVSERGYLGVSEGDPFQLSQVKAEILIIEVFSMYCPHCQREAEDVNKLYELIENDPQLRGRIKLIGIGAGNTPFEVNVFREKYQVPFPLFADADFSLYNSFGKVRTPYFFGIRLKTGGRPPRVFYAKVGGLKGAQRFLKEIVQKSQE